MRAKRLRMHGGGAGVKSETPVDALRSFWEEKRAISNRIADVLEGAEQFEEASALRGCSRRVAKYDCGECGRRELRAMDSCWERICPFCSGRRASRTVADLWAALRSRFRIDRPFRRLLMQARLVTLTFPNILSLDRREVDRLRGWFRRLRRTPLFKDRVRGGLYAIEVTYRKETDEWHLHLHVLVFGGFVPVNREWQLAGDPGNLQDEWARITGVPNVVVDVRPVKEYGPGGAGVRSALREVCKYLAKGTELADAGAKRIVEFMRAFEGVRAIESFGILHGWRTEAGEAKSFAYAGAAAEEGESPCFECGATRWHYRGWSDIERGLRWVERRLPRTGSRPPPGDGTDSPSARDRVVALQEVA